MGLGNIYGPLKYPWSHNYSFGVSPFPTCYSVHKLTPIVFICEIAYVITIGLVKISILFFYLHVFPKRSFRIQCFIVMAFCSASCITFLLVTIFQCHPLSYSWDKTTKGTCVNYNSVSWANAGINIFQDILIVLLPISELNGLQLSKKKKIGLYAMFGLGSLYVYISLYLISPYQRSLY